MTFLAVTLLVFLSLFTLSVIGSLMMLVNPPDWQNHSNKFLRKLDRLIDLAAPVMMVIAIGSLVVAVVLGFILSLTVLL